MSSLENEKPIVVTGRVPNSVRQQLRKAKSTTRKAKLHSKKTFKKIKLPKHTTTVISKPQSSNLSGNKKSCFKKGKSKTFKKVRFSLPSSGILNDSFREPERMRMKNLTNKHNHQRSKNRTMKRSFRVREQTGHGETERHTIEQSGSGKGNDLKQSGLGLRSLIDSLVKNTDGDIIEIV